MLDTALIPGDAKMVQDPTILALKEKLQSGIQLQFAAKPILAKLAEMLDEAICLALPSGDQMLVVDLAPSSRQGEISSFVGRRYPQTSVFEDASVAEPVADFYPLEEVSAEAAGQENPARMIKVPLWNGQQKVCGWLCLLGLVDRLTPKRLRELLPVLRAEGEALSVSLSKGWI